MSRDGRYAMLKREATHLRPPMPIVPLPTNLPASLKVKFRKIFQILPKHKFEFALVYSTAIFMLIFALTALLFPGRLQSFLNKILPWLLAHLVPWIS